MSEVIGGEKKERMDKEGRKRNTWREARGAPSPPL
jgi:hypothetical protein